MGYIQQMREFIGHRPLLMVAGAVLILNSHDEVLLQKRTDSGDWGIPGGSMELGETIEDTARREALEETGLILEDLTLFGVFSGKELYYVYPNGDQVYNVTIVFICRRYQGVLCLDESEGTDLKFFPSCDLPAPLSPPIIPVLRRLTSWLAE